MDHHAAQARHPQAEVAFELLGQLVGGGDGQRGVQGAVERDLELAAGRLDLDVVRLTASGLREELLDGLADQRFGRRPAAGRNVDSASPVGSRCVTIRVTSGTALCSWSSNAVACWWAASSESDSLTSRCSSTIRPPETD